MKCMLCTRPLVGRQTKYCTRCINADKNNNRSRRNKLPEMFVSIDTEGVEIDGIMRTISVSYGREDGRSDSLSAPPGEWLTGQETVRWLIDETTRVFVDTEGIERKPAHVSFHFGYDTAVIAKDFTDDLTLIYKATARNRNLLCNTAHHDGEECLKLHRYDEHIQQLVITEGGENDVLAWHEPSELAIATSVKRRFYAEHRPFGDRMEMNRRLDIHDTGTAFIGGLEAVIDQWSPELSTEQREAIRWGKAARKDGTFRSADVSLVEQYSEAECVAHARVCRQLLDSLTDAGHIPMKPSELFGSGSIASAALGYYGVAPRKLTMTSDQMVRGLTVDQLPTMTYFGGLIETPVLGQLTEPVDGTDINSAYPAHMLSLPCMREGHGRWTSRPGSRVTEAPDGALGYVLASWIVDTPSTPPFLVRTKDALVRQPLTGSRVWVTLPEYQTAVAEFGTDVIAHHVVWYDQECECANPLAFLSDLYDKRAAIRVQMKAIEIGHPEAFKTRTDWMLLNCQQMAIKLVINSIYGKFAQRRPSLGKYTNMHYASHITGCTRAQVRRQSWKREREGGTVVYTHTDSVLSIGGVPTDEGSQLGAWGLEKQSHGFTVIQPGLAVSIDGGKVASRGCGAKEFRTGVEEWLTRADLTQPPTEWPALEIKRTFMLGRRLAIFEGTPDLAGNFVARDFKPGFTSRKRNMFAARPLAGNPRAWVIPPCQVVYDDEIAEYEDIRTFETELSRLIAQGQFDDGL